MHKKLLEITRKLNCALWNL